MVEWKDQWGFLTVDSQNWGCAQKPKTSRILCDAEVEYGVD